LNDFDTFDFHLKISRAHAVLKVSTVYMYTAGFSFKHVFTCICALIKCSTY